MTLKNKLPISRKPRKGYECIGIKEDCFYYDENVYLGECTALAGCKPLREKLKQQESP